MDDVYRNKPGVPQRERGAKAIYLRWIRYAASARSVRCPRGTQSSAVIMDDPDAPNGTFTHWLAYDVPAGTGELKVDRGKTLRNGFGREVGSLATRPSSAG